MWRFQPTDAASGPPDPKEFYSNQVAHRWTHSGTKSAVSTIRSSWNSRSIFYLDHHVSEVYLRRMLLLPTLPHERLSELLFWWLDRAIPHLP